MPSFKLVPRATGHNRKVGTLATAELQTMDGQPINIIPLEVLWDREDPWIHHQLCDGNEVTVRLAVVHD